MPPQYIPVAYTPPAPDPDEINLLEYVYVLVKAKRWIIGCTLAGLIIGYIAAFIKGTSYVAEAVIAAKESPSSQKAPNLSGLGMFGGIVASQLNISTNPGLDKIDVILESKKFFAEMADAYKLYPILFPKLWDMTANTWLPNIDPPKPLGVGDYVKEKFFKKETNKNGTMTITIKTPDSLLTDTLMSACLAYLDTYIKTSVQNDAKENKDYLENQLIGVTDPLLRGKLQELIASEVERMMVVSKEAFRVVDPKDIGKTFKEKKLFPLIGGMAMFFLVTIAVVFGHALSGAEKLPEDKQYLEGIKRELGRW